MTDVFRDEQGFTTIGAAIAILLSCILAFFCLWAARSQSRAAGVQAACDAAALAAQVEVAEFVLSARVADATLLSMSLAGLVLSGAGIVCCCVPSAQAAGAKLTDTGKAILDKRDDVARAEEKALNAAQDALPMTAAAQSQAVLQENGSELGGSGVGYIELVPDDAPDVDMGFSDAANDAAEHVQNAAPEVSEAAAVAEEAAQKAADARKEAWLADCGNAPGYCMAERAAKLSGISDAENPIRHSVSTWSFSDALARARSYYAHRASEEAPQSQSVEERVRSVARAKFYAYASEELAKGYVRDDGASAADIYFPELFGNTDEMRETRLYTQQDYPVASGVLHAFAECPGIEGAVESSGSLADLEAGTYQMCPVCRFDAATLGKVAAASTSIENGFEHHYRKVADAARAYCEAQAEALPAAQEVKGAVEGCLDAIGQAIGDASAHRVKAYPPGRFGALAAYAFDAQDSESASSFFDEPDLGQFAAVSAAVLMEDEDENVLSSLLDGVADDIGPPLSDAGDAVLGLWGSLIDAYGSGVDGLREGASGLLGGIPLASAAGLGDWAADALMGVLESAGLEPADTAAAKPVVVNAEHVALRGDGPVASAVVALKQSVGTSSSPRSLAASLNAPAARRARRAAGSALDSRHRVPPGRAVFRARCAAALARIRPVRPPKLSRLRRVGSAACCEKGPDARLGQMTVEAAVVLPVMVALAFIVANALVFVGDCAAFDIVARDAIRLQADDGYEGSQGAAEVRARIEEGLAMEHEEISVTCERTALGHVRYTAKTAFLPPFLQGASVFGVQVAPLEHEVSMTVSPYRKGVVV